MADQCEHPAGQILGTYTLVCVVGWLLVVGLYHSIGLLIDGLAWLVGWVLR